MAHSDHTRTASLPCRRAGGFTFMELLIVMVIMGLAISIVAPDLFKSFGKIEAQGEVKKIEELLRSAGMNAFLSQSPITVKMSGSSMAVLPAQRLYSFKRIAFPQDLEIRFNRRGGCDHEEIQVTGGRISYSIVLNDSKAIP